MYHYLISVLMRVKLNDREDSDNKQLQSRSREFRAEYQTTFPIRFYIYYTHHHPYTYLSHAKNI